MKNAGRHRLEGCCISEKDSIWHFLIREERSIGHSNGVIGSWVWVAISARADYILTIFFTENTLGGSLAWITIIKELFLPFSITEIYKFK
jgi:hypothetical protein